ncbi:hypothetical protein PQX77_002101 [Marasmius sp. AFHP31]|nr:hypothetical protein PQX77_002101 [Marasmius sp. AFHP31]
MQKTGGTADLILEFHLDAADPGGSWNTAIELNSKDEKDAASTQNLLIPGVVCPQKKAKKRPKRVNLSENTCDSVFLNPEEVSIGLEYPDRPDILLTRRYYHNLDRGDFLSIGFTGHKDWQCFQCVKRNAPCTPEVHKNDKGEVVFTKATCKECSNWQEPCTNHLHIACRLGAEWSLLDYPINEQTVWDLAMHWGFIEYNCAKHMYYGVLNKNNREQLCSKLDTEIIGNVDDFLARQMNNEAAWYGLQKIDYWTREYAEGCVDQYIRLPGGYSGEKLGWKAHQGKNVGNVEPGPSSLSRGKGGKSTQQSPSKMLRGTHPLVNSHEKPLKVESPASDALSSSNTTIRIPPSPSNVCTIAPPPLPPASRLFNDDDDPNNVSIGVLHSDKPDWLPAPPPPELALGLTPSWQGVRPPSEPSSTRGRSTQHQIVFDGVEIPHSTVSGRGWTWTSPPAQSPRPSDGSTATPEPFPGSMAMPEPYTNREGFGLPDLTLVQQDVPMGPEASAGDNALPPTPLPAQHTLLTTRIQTLELEVERLSERNVSLEPLSQQNQWMLTESQTLQAENNRLTTLLRSNEQQIAMVQQCHNQELEGMWSRNKNLMAQVQQHLQADRDRTHRVE